jgi:hypothetical protein
VEGSAEAGDAAEAESDGELADAEARIGGFQCVAGYVKPARL